MQAHRKHRRRAAQRACRVAHWQLLPGDQRQNLLVAWTDLRPCRPHGGLPRSQQRRPSRAHAATPIASSPGAPAQRRIASAHCARPRTATAAGRSACHPSDATRPRTSQPPPHQPFRHPHGGPRTHALSHRTPHRQPRTAHPIAITCRDTSLSSPEPEIFHGHFQARPGVSERATCDSDADPCPAVVDAAVLAGSEVASKHFGRESDSPAPVA